MTRSGDPNAVGPIAPGQFPGSGVAAPFPLLASTHFCMEVLLQGSVLDLRSVHEVVSVDPGAVLRLFAAAIEETASSEDCPERLQDCPERLQDCIIALGRAGLIRALRYTPSTWHQQALLSAFADHAVRVGRCAQIAAQAVGLCEETAYLVGLLHDIGSLPAQLAWSTPLQTASWSAGPIAYVAEAYHLPLFLRGALASLDSEAEPGLWRTLLLAAHEMAASDSGGAA